MALKIVVLKPFFIYFCFVYVVGDVVFVLPMVSLHGAISCVIFCVKLLKCRTLSKLISLVAHYHNY